VRVLLYVIFWINAVLGLPLSLIGLLMAYSLVASSTSFWWYRVGGILLGGAVVTGWWLLYGYGCAVFRGNAPIQWADFWQLSSSMNLAAVVTVVLFAIVFPDPSSGVTLTDLPRLNTVLELSVYWIWPLVMSILSLAILRIGNGPLQERGATSETDA
jgi:hypothetical protein